MNQPQAVGKPVDLSNCDREPIHLLGRVQEFGFLVATTSDWLISNVSANLNAFVDGDAESMIGEPISALLPPEIVHNLRNRLQLQGGNTLPEVVPNVSFPKSIDDLVFDVSIHVSGKSIILEFEPSASREEADRNVAAVQQAMQRISTMSDIDSILNFATRFTSAISGFDRVMAYVFHADDSGEVVAETHASGMEPFLGLRYPASDIPKQARALYVKSPVRSIVDSSSLGAPILPKPASEEEQLDLSNSVLRSVSPIHLEYLQNMGVAASMSISLVVEGKLWGLLACHHRQPKLLSQAERNALVLFGQMLSLIITSKLANDKNLHLSNANDQINQFSRAIAAPDNLGSVLLSQSEMMLEVMSADGFSVIADDQVHSVGHTPKEAEIRQIAKRLNVKPAGEIFTTNKISSLLAEGAEPVSAAAGLLSIPISKTPRDYILFFRREVVKRVRWAGDPQKPVEVGPNGARLTPRKSFEEWQSLVEGQSEEWSSAEIAVAEQFRITLLEVVLRLTDETVIERQKAADKQEVLIAELNHRVRNILSLVRSLISQTSKKESTVSEFSKVLESRVYALAMAHDQITKKNWSAASIKDLIATEAEAYLQDKSVRLIMSGPDAHVVPVAYSAIALVMHEMITNSAKYGSLSDQRGRVELTLSYRQDGSLDIHWQEQDGPEVAEPTRRGFGSTIIERSIPFELHGKSAIEYAPDGVKAHFWIPAAHLADSNEAASDVGNDDTHPAEPAAQTSANGDLPSDVLVVEDNLIIAVDTESVLRELGIDTVRVCADVETALEEIEKQLPEFAFLDVNLGDETSLNIARALRERGVPFVFASGFGEAQPLKEFEEEVSVITKPYDKETLKKALLAVS